MIVNEGKIVGEGWHKMAGGPHAEVHALMAAGPQAKGATAYVTLEPCNHHGRTPPCSEGLIASGISRVVAAMEDPNPRVAGRGLQRLREAGIKTDSGLFIEAAESLNPGFIQRMRTGKPWIRSKIAMSLDGQTAMASGESRWITGPDARRDAHRLRARSSAIVTGSGTLIADNPRLDVRLGDTSADIVEPARILLDSHLRCAHSLHFFQLPGRWDVLSVASPKSDDAHHHVLPPAPNSDSGLDLNAVSAWLGEQGFNEVLFECGPTLNGSLLKSGIVDEWIIYMAPSILGHQGKGIFNMPGLELLADAPKLRLVESRKVGKDLKLTFRPH